MYIFFFNISKSWICNVAMKYFAIFDKNVATIFQLQWNAGNIHNNFLQYSVLCGIIIVNLSDSACLSWCACNITYSQMKTACGIFSLLWNPSDWSLFVTFRNDNTYWSPILSWRGIGLDSRTFWSSCKYFTEIFHKGCFVKIVKLWECNTLIGIYRVLTLKTMWNTFSASLSRSAESATEAIFLALHSVLHALKSTVSHIIQPSPL